MVNHLVTYTNINVGKAEYKRNATALHLAVQGGHREITSVFCRPGVLNNANLNRPDRDGNTALHFSAYSSHPEAQHIAHLLLALGANVNLRDAFGRTALHICCLHHDETSLLNLFLEYGANPNVPSVDQSTALHIAIDRDQLRMARCLVSHGASMNLKDARGRMLIEMQVSHSVRVQIYFIYPISTSLIYLSTVARLYPNQTSLDSR